MAAATHPSTSPARQHDRLRRFSVGERVLHWTNAALFLIMLATGAALYIPQVSEAVGRRGLVLAVHVYCGVALPVPLVLAALSGRAFRDDARRLNRWDDDDRRWLRRWGRDPRVRSGKFNAGQKLNAAFTVGAIVVMLGTGLIMKFQDLWPLAWRTGATFVHDWLFLAAAVVVVGHILYAVGDADALRSMVHGWVPAAWARRHAPRWYEEETGLPVGKAPR
jgi:formate dehydrogenase subunit gamma